MVNPFHFELSGDALQPEVLGAWLADPAAGAVVTFEGRVRDRNEGKPVSGLAYQAYAALALPTGRAILQEEAARHGLLRVCAAHRTGTLAIGDLAVWVGVAAAHRQAAFAGAAAIMERLKYELPVWKKETYPDGSTDWVGSDMKSPVTGEVPVWDARLEAIYLSPGHDFRGHHGKPRGNHPVIEVAEVECVAGLGLRGDRYFGFKADFKGQVTFFSAEVVDAVRERFALPELPAEVFRRNLIVRGVELGQWVGRRFRFQGIDFEGSEECSPCYWMDQAAAEGVEDFLRESCRGGLRARILSDGVLRVDGQPSG
jgi:molybdopterin synthase catalytic subunit